MRKYHLTLTNGNERDITAADYEIREGALNFIGDDGERVITYAAGTWFMVEVETRDDRG